MSSGSRGFVAWSTGNRPLQLLLMLDNERPRHLAGSAPGNVEGSPLKPRGCQAARLPGCMPCHAMPCHRDQSLSLHYKPPPNHSQMQLTSRSVPRMSSASFRDSFHLLIQYPSTSKVHHPTRCGGPDYGLLGAQMSTETSHPLLHNPLGLTSPKNSTPNID